LKTVGFLGLSGLGLTIAERLLNAGYTLIVWDRNRKERESFRGRASVAEGLRELVQKADHIFVSLEDTSAVLDASLSPQGIYDSLKPGKIVVGVTTISPAASVQLADRFRRKRAFFLEAPVVGGADVARSGELIALVGGDRTAYQEVLGAIKTFSNRVYYVGGNGAALTLKLVFMGLLAARAEILGEAAVLLEKKGIDPSFLVQLVETTGDTVFPAGDDARSVSGRNYQGKYTLGALLEDLRLATEVAKDVRASTPLLNLLESIYAAASIRGYDAEGYTAIAELLREINKKKE